MDQSAKLMLLAGVGILGYAVFKNSGATAQSRTQYSYGPWQVGYTPQGSGAYFPAGQNGGNYAGIVNTALQFVGNQLNSGSGGLSNSVPSYGYGGGNYGGYGYA